MQQRTMIGNQFQTYMWAKFQKDFTSSMAVMANVKGKEDLVFEYISDMATLFQPVKYDNNNPLGLYSDYSSFKKRFVRYWSNALDISKEDADKLRDIFEEEISSQESCKKRIVVSVFFENDKALTADDCLDAICEVMKIV